MYFKQLPHKSTLKIAKIHLKNYIVHIYKIKFH